VRVTPERFAELRGLVNEAEPGSRALYRDEAVECLDEIERLNAKISKMERCVGDAAAWLVSSDVRHEFMESVRKRWSEL
jgi:hypothetical protein